MPRYKYYKVVRVIEDGRMVSSTHLGCKNYLNKVMVTYRLGEWTYPILPKSRLFVFSTLKAARSFFLPTSKGLVSVFRIFECEVENPIPFKVVPGMLETYTLYRNFWQDKEINTRLLSCPPNKTVGVTAVKLIRKVR